ncbi:MAG: hypothetical protein Q9191_003087 [Dirinaria sp. TL-2023a]
MASTDKGIALNTGEEYHTFPAILFDFDGTLVDSTEAIVKHWHKIGHEIGVDPAVILQASHGRRTIETLQLYDPSKANWEYVSQVEGLIPREFGADAALVPGAKAILASLEAVKARWAIATSGTRALIQGWLDVTKLPPPQHLVVAEDCEKGKPSGEPYLLAKELLGLSAETVALVIEDSPAGVVSGKAAKCKVLGLATTHSMMQLRQAGADWIVKDLRSVEVTPTATDHSGAGEVTIKICNVLAN